MNDSRTKNIPEKPKAKRKQKLEGSKGEKRWNSDSATENLPEKLKSKRKQKDKGNKGEKRSKKNITY